MIIEYLTVGFILGLIWVINEVYHDDGITTTEEEDDFYVAVLTGLLFAFVVAWPLYFVAMGIAASLDWKNNR